MHKTIPKNKTKVFRSKNNEEETFQVFPMSKKTVSKETISHSFDVIRIYLTDDGIGGISDHLDQIEAINAAGENDVIQIFCIGCPGGSADTIVAFLNALANTDAHTVSVVEGHNASAATMFSMVTNEVHIGNYASFMIHSISGATGGIMRNTAEAAKFYERQYAAFIEEVYQGFLLPEELALVHNGREIYLDASEIQERLEARQEYFQEKAKEQQEKEDAERADREAEENSNPKKQRKKRVK